MTETEKVVDEGIRIINDMSYMLAANMADLMKDNINLQKAKEMNKVSQNMMALAKMVDRSGSSCLRGAMVLQGEKKNDKEELQRELNELKEKLARLESEESHGRRNGTHVR